MFFNFLENIYEKHGVFMAIYLNNVRFVKATKHDGTLEHREIKEYYIDNPDDVADLPGRDKIHECSKATVINENIAPGSTYILMSNGWVNIGLDKSYKWSR